MYKKVSLLFILLLLLLLSVFAQQENNWNGKSYEEFKSLLIKSQKSSPDKALELANFLMKKFPQEKTPYGVAVTLYNLKKEYEKSEKVLKTAIQKVKPNNDFYLRLAYFYKRVLKSETKLDALIENFIQNEKNNKEYNLTIAKFYIVKNQSENAILQLKSAISGGDTSFSTIKLLFQLLRKTGRVNELWDLILSYTLKPEIPLENRIDFFETLVSVENHYQENDIRQISKILTRLVDEINDFSESRNLVNNTILSIGQKGEFNALKNIFEKKENRKEWGGNSVWIYTLILQNTGEQDKFHELVDKYEGTNPNLLEQKARLLENDQQTTRALQTMQKLAQLRADDIRIQITLAQFLNRHEKRSQSQDALDKITINDIDENLKPLYFALCFDNLTELRWYSQLVQKWVQSADYLEYQSQKTFLDGIFNNLPESTQHFSILTNVEDNLTTGSASEPALLLLKTRLAKEIREFPLFFETADKFLSLQKQFDSDAIYEYVEEAIKRGLRWVPTEDNKEPDIVITNENFIAFAEKWLERLIDKNPNIPDFHVDIIYIRKAQNRIREALEQVEKLAKNNKNDAERIHLTAYVLATSGFPSRALSYYEKAIQIKPRIVRYKMNYGGCLIRNGDFENAIRVYRDVITGGYTAKTWNIRNVLRQIMYCYNQLNKKPEFLKIFQELKKRKDIPPHDLYLNAAFVLGEFKEYDKAIEILKEFISSYSDNEMIFNAYMQMAEMFTEQEKYDQAIEIFDQCQKRFQNDKIKVIDCIFNQGELQRRKGDFQNAIKIWTNLAENHPHDEYAQNALVSAAQTAEQGLNDINLAKKLYQRFLDMNPKDLLKILVVKHKLDLLNSAENQNEMP